MVAVMRVARDLPDYALRLKAALALRGWTMEQLADVIAPEYHLSKSTLDKMAQGKRPPRSYDYAIIAEALGVPDQLLRGGEISAPARDDGYADLLREVQKVNRDVGEIRGQLRRIEARLPRPGYEQAADEPG